MSIAQYYPFNGKKNRVRMGLSFIPASEWIIYEEDFAQRIIEKKDLINTQRSRVIQSMAVSLEAQTELLDNILLFLTEYESDLFTINDDLIICHLDDSTYELSEYRENPLELISYLAADDFCILEPDNEDYRLTAASVCTPTYWDLTEKIGKQMPEVHASIAGLEEKIGRMIRHFFMHLKPDAYYQRSNWFFTTSTELALFKDDYIITEQFEGINTSNIMDKVYLRCERQTFRKLVNTKNIVFGIKIYVEPLNIVQKNPEIAQDLILSISAMSEDQKKLFAIDLFEKELLDYLASVM